MLRRVVYTALLGSHERLSAQPRLHKSSIDCICFTDDPGLHSDEWRMVLVDPGLPLDPVRSARRLKILGHPLIDGYDQSLWIDNRVILDADPEDLFDLLGDDYDIVLPKHSFRQELRHEFEAVLRTNKDSPRSIREQLFFYEHALPSLLDQPTYWTGILLRRNNAAVREMCAEWFHHVLRYSRRDQLSVNFALERVSIKKRVVPIDNISSGWHHWLSEEDAGRAHASSASRPPAFRYGLRMLAADSVRRVRLASGARSRRGREGSRRWAALTMTRLTAAGARGRRAVDRERQKDQSIDCLNEAAEASDGG